jgi:hypothetical protein
VCYCHPNKTAPRALRCWQQREARTAGDALAATGPGYMTGYMKRQRAGVDAFDRGGMNMLLARLCDKLAPDGLAVLSGMVAAMDGRAARTCC